MFLSPDDMRALTGRVHADAQRAWLTKHGWPFVPDADGRPKVLRTVLEARMGLKPQRVMPDRSPRLDLVR